tara:strand:+ start:6113 stop:6640 length:528 start_codon:yes stop_codon:yes gene_type:complete
MPAVSHIHVEVLGPLIAPFERSKKPENKKVIGKGEGHNDAFLDKIHDGINNNYPEPYYQISVDELNHFRIMEGGSFPAKCYLWVIDEVSIKLIWEKTSNVLRGEELPDKPYVCHTNITGCNPAYIGGEIYFCENGHIYVNFKSDRYGWPETEEKKQMALQYMEYVGYKNLIMTEF